VILRVTADEGRVVALFAVAMFVRFFGVMIEMFICVGDVDDLAGVLHEGGRKFVS
jgi:hypothetical protein